LIRATLKSLLARKLRLVLSGLAVVLAVMFIAGSFVLTDTLGRSFDNLFKDAYENVDLQVAGKPTIDSESGFAAPVTIPASTVDRVRSVPGVSEATGFVEANGARVIGKNGKLLANASGARLAGNWVREEGDLIKLRAGDPPRGDNDVVINGQVAKDGDFKVGDPIDIITLADGLRHTFRVSGIVVYSGGRDSIGGEHYVLFTEPVAQRLMLGEPDVYSVVHVRAASGTSIATLQAALRSAMGPQFLVETGDELAAKNAQPIKTIFGYFNRILLGFGAVALLVGVFLILNTFSIIVAQRTRELALMRAMGAGRLQVVGSVLIEALIVGLIGSTLGFLAGLGLGAVGAWGLTKLVGGVDLAGLGIPAASYLLSFTVGTMVTVLAALVPAVKASRIAPVEAMREAAATDRPLTWLTIAGGVVTAAGAALLAFGLAGQGDATLTLILVGVLLTLVGVALLTPFVCRPVVSILGRIFSWSVPGKLGRRNSARNPRRTAITAAAVMIGIALVTGISTVFASVSTTATRAIDKQLAADLIVAGEQTSEVAPVIDTAALRRIKELPEVSNAAAVTFEFFAKANGRDAIVFAYDDWAAARRALKLGTGSGDVTTLGEGQVILDPQTAEDRNLKVGDRVALILPRGERTYTVVGITTESNANNGFVIPMADAQRLFRTAAPTQAYLKLRDGASQSAVKRQVDEILKDSPEVTVQTRDEFISNQLFFINFLLGAVQILLLIAIAISILGVINTLVLSVLERTRELGMLRAIGLRRSQTMRMITVESVVISLFGTLLGLGVGAGLGIAVVRALKDQGITDLSLPWALMLVYLFAALIIGVGAAVIPAIRAARLNVLNAIAYE
jgi:putative ABC transport system permease protein